MIPADGPFVLLDDARASGASPARLYVNPVRTISAYSSVQIAALLEELRAAKEQKLHVAGYLAYDAGTALLPQLMRRLPGLVYSSDLKQLVQTP
jgi:para-aminobenzoate synthetase / 4-amino-4-deoxychorismate lyase